MKKYVGEMTKQEYEKFLIENLKADAKHFNTSHGELRMYYSELIEQNECELVKMGYTWEQLENMIMEF